MVVHLQQEYPEETNRRGEEGLRALVREGIEAARKYNVVLERDVAGYIALMLVVSPNFDESPETPWAKAILTDRDLMPREKFDRIYEHIRFDHENRSDEVMTTGGEAPQPLHPEAVCTADRELWTNNPELERRRLTMDIDDEVYREEWMASYKEALQSLYTAPATSRPRARVGDPVTDPSRSGELMITLVDAETQAPVPEASVQVSGPVIERVVADSSGTVRFGEIALGEYEILAVDRQHRLGQGRITVGPGKTRETLSCRRVGPGVT